jgi:hypothetical protein
VGGSEITRVKQLSLSVVLVLLLSPAPLMAGEWYYVVVFSSQTVPLRPRYTHTFATVIKVTADGCDQRQGHIEAVTISWLPATFAIRPLRLKSEVGVNASLEDSMRVALGQKQRVSQWGPYQTDAGLYEAAQDQAARLARGERRYRALDPLFDPAGFTDCIHAVADLDSRLCRTYRPEFVMCGDRASARLVGELIALGRIQCPQATHDWLNARLGLDAYPIRHVDSAPSNPCPR